MCGEQNRLWALQSSSAQQLCLKRMKGKQAWLKISRTLLLTGAGGDRKIDPLLKKKNNFHLEKNKQFGLGRISSSDCSVSVVS